MESTSNQKLVANSNIAGRLTQLNKRLHSNTYILIVYNLEIRIINLDDTDRIYLLVDFTSIQTDRHICLNAETQNCNKLFPHANSWRRANDTTALGLIVFTLFLDNPKTPGRVAYHGRL